MEQNWNKQMESLQSITEQVYLDMGNRCRSLSGDIRNAVEKTEALTSDFRQQIGSQQDDSLTSTIDKIEEYVSTAQDTVGKDSRKAHSVLNNMLEGFSRMHQIGGLIRGIKDSSELMEVLALNSMVVAVKAGSSGGGFSYITEVLRTTASKTILLADRVHRSGDQIIRQFDSIESLIKKIQNRRLTLDDQFKTIQNKGIRNLRRSIDDFMDLLEKVSAHEKAIGNSSATIIEEIQKQDILRQSLDHVVLYLKKIPPTVNTNDVKALLNHLTLQVSADQFSQSVLGEIETILLKSIHIFTDSLVNMKQEAETNSRLIKSVDISEDCRNVEASNYFQGMKCLLQNFQGLETDLDRINEEERNLADLMKHFFDKIGDLQEELGKFDRLLTLYGNINLLAKIEIAKQSALREIDASVEEIGTITARIENDLTRIREINKDFLQEYSSVGKLMKDSTARLKTIRDLYRSTVEQIGIEMNSAYQMLSERMTQYRRIGMDIVAHAGEMEKSTERLHEPLDKVRQMLSALEDQQRQAKERKELILKEEGLSEWKVEDAKIRDLVEQFTINKHRSIAGQINGVDLFQDEAEEGSVTLF